MGRFFINKTNFSSAAQPLPIVRTLDKDGVESEIESLRSHHRGLVLVPTTPQIVNEFCNSLIKGMFLFVGSNIQAYPKCFDSCVEVCKKTGAYRATSWNSWEGFSKLMEKIELVERLTRHTGMLHCLTASSLIVAIAMQQVVLHGKRGEQDKVARFLREFDCYTKAATAIHYFEMNYRQHILTLDQVWDMTASMQRPPTRSIEQWQPVISEGRMQMSRNNASREAITFEEEPMSVKEEPSVAYQAAPPAALEAMPSTVYQAAPPIAHQVAEFREERYEEPISMSMPAPESSLVRETHKQIIRADVMLHLQPLLDRLKSEDWNGVIQRDMMRVLTDKNIKVLTASAKSVLGIWATRSKNDMVLSWLEQARDDVVAFQWTERYVEPAPPMLLDSHSVYNVFYDLDAIIAGIPQSTLRGQLRTKVNVLRDIFDQQERSHKEEMLNRVDKVQMDIAKLSFQMAASQQTADSNQLAEPNQTAASQPKDTSFIEISDTDDDAVSKVKEKKKDKREKKKTKKTEPKPKGAGRKRSRREMEEE